MSAFIRGDADGSNGRWSPPLDEQQRPKSAPGQSESSEGQPQPPQERKKKKVKRNKKSAEERLKEINEKIAKIREERAALSRMGKGRVQGKRVDYAQSPKKPPFHHPQLEYVYGEIMNSPYLTNPIDYHYDDEMFEMDAKLKQLRQRGRKYEKLPEYERLYDVKEVKKSFIKKVAYYVKPPVSPLKKVNKVVPES